MFIKMPRIPTAAEVRKLTDSEYTDLCNKFFNYCWEVVGAMATLKCDLFELRHNSEEVSNRVNDIVFVYESEHDKAHEVIDWLLKVRHFGYKGEFQK